MQTTPISYEVQALMLQTEDHLRTLCNDRPAAGWREMSVDQYIREGRSEVLRTVTHGEIFRAASFLGKPMTEFAPSERA